MVVEAPVVVEAAVVAVMAAPVLIVSKTPPCKEAGAEALATLRLESLPMLRDELTELRGKLDAERDARRVAEIAAAELRGQHGIK